MEIDGCGVEVELGTPASANLFDLLSSGTEGNLKLQAHIVPLSCLFCAEAAAQCDALACGLSVAVVEHLP